MIIKKRPIITWLLTPETQRQPNDIFLSKVSNPTNIQILNNHLIELNNLRIRKTDWGLPELLTSSFEDIMYKSALSFEKIMPQLFHEFSEQKECGILLCKRNVTLVYEFSDDKLHIWFFVEQDGKSIFKFYSFNESKDKQIRVGVYSSLLMDNYLFDGNTEDRHNFIGSIANFIASYVAVKNYIEVETITVPEGKFTNFDGTPLEYIDKKKIINQIGQKVIVMDSKWFRKIINDNDIFVRGYFKLQPKKNAQKEWYKELIYIAPTVRHGYHREAKIEDKES